MNLIKFLSFLHNKPTNIQFFFFFFLEEIKKIPLDDAPELLGLQNSASGYYYLEESKYLSEAYTKIHAQCERKYRNFQFISLSLFFSTIYLE